MLTSTKLKSSSLSDPVGAPDFTLPVSILAQIIESLKVDIAAQSIPKLQINIASITSGVVFNVAQSGTWTINVQTATGVKLNINIASIDSGVVFSVAQSGSWTINAAQSGSWTVNAAQSGSWTINVTGSVTVTSGTVNVQTSGGANIVVDKLTQGAYTERQSTLANNGATATMVDSNLTNKRGKFFPRGCRGFINSIEIYCYNGDSVSHTFTVKLSPMPGMGPVATFTLYVAAYSSAAWRAISVKKFWNYDSLFIWVSSDSDSYAMLGYDSGTPYDYYVSTDEVTWTFDNYRYWFRVNFSGETVGDLPVSGTVNTIAIPNLVSRIDSGLINVPAGGTYYKEVNGAGSLLVAYFRYYTSASTTVLRPSILCDGVEVLPMSGAIVDWRNQLVGLAHSDIYIAQWDTTLNYYTLAVALPLKFRRSLKVGLINPGASDYGAYLHIIYELIG
jgi:hypothetical protein